MADIERDAREGERERGRRAYHLCISKEKRASLSLPPASLASTRGCFSRQGVPALSPSLASLRPTAARLLAVPRHRHQLDSRDKGQREGVNSVLRSRLLLRQTRAGEEANPSEYCRRRMRDRLLQKEKGNSFAPRLSSESEE